MCLVREAVGVGGRQGANSIYVAPSGSISGTSNWTIFHRADEIEPSEGIILTFYMESQDAGVIAIGLEPEADCEQPPHARLDLAAIPTISGKSWGSCATDSGGRTGRRAARQRCITATSMSCRRSWSYDVAPMAAALRHTRDPLPNIEG